MSVRAKQLDDLKVCQAVLMANCLAPTCYNFMVSVTYFQTAVLNRCFIVRSPVALPGCHYRENRMRKLQSSIVLMMMLIAIILAVGVFLAINAVRNRSSSTDEVSNLAANNFLVTVGVETVALQVDPNLRPTIIDNPAPVVVEESPRVDQPVEQTADTATPVPTLPPAIVEQPTAVPVAPVTVEKIIYQPYTVQQGDTLYSLSQAFATSIALMADKGISQTSLVPGTTINIPVGNPEFCTGRGRPYAVGEGDTAFNIGQRFNTTPQNLQAINGLDANFTVKIADIICVP